MINFIQSSLKGCGELPSMEPFIENLDFLYPSRWALHTPLCGIINRHPCPLVLWSALANGRHYQKVRNRTGTGFFFPQGLFSGHIASDFIPLPKATGVAGRTLKATIILGSSDCLSPFPVMTGLCSELQQNLGCFQSHYRFPYTDSLFLDLSSFTHFKYTSCFLWDPDTDTSYLILQKNIKSPYTQNIFRALFPNLQRC